MANVPPATVTITSSTGPGQAVTSLKFTDVVAIVYDFVKNTIGITRAGSNSTQYYDYSAAATITQTIASGITTISIS